MNTGSKSSHTNHVNQAGNKRGRFVPLLVLLSIALLLWLLFLVPFRYALVVEKEGAAVLILPLRTGEEFAIRYIHSVNRSPVIDTIGWDGGTRLVVRSSLFQAYGAGIPSDGDGVGDPVRLTEEGFLLAGIEAPHEEIALITGTFADHHLLYRDRQIRLGELVGEQKLVYLRARRVSMWDALLHNG